MLRTARVRRALALGGMTAAALLAACSGSDKRVRSLSKDIARDSALTLLGASASDSTPYIYHDARYLVDGRSVEVLYYDAQGRKKFSSDSVPDKELTPVVLEGGKVTGWGWKHFDKVAKATNMAVPPREK